MALTKITAGGLADNSVVTASVADSQVTLAKTTGVQAGWKKLVALTASSWDGTESGFGANSITNTYEEYMIKGGNIQIGADESQVGVQFYIGSWVSVGYEWFEFNSSTGGATVSAQADGNASYIQILRSMGNDSGESGDFTIMLSNPSATDNDKRIYFTGTGYDSGTALKYHSGIGGVHNDAAMTNMRFLPNQGVISSGEFTLYGLVN